LPSKEEWEVLEKIGCSWRIAGKYLKATSGWKNEFGNGTDDFGFSALPSGGYDGKRDFYSIGTAGYWWVSDSERGVYIDNDNISIGVIFDNYGYSFFSVRCVKDNETAINTSTPTEKETPQ